MAPLKVWTSVARLGVPLALAAVLLGRTPVRALADRTVQVRQGDTLSAISLANYGDTAHVLAIMTYNHLASPNRIYAGQTLRLPGLDAAGQAPDPVFQEGVATWYGPGFEGQTTKCGQIYHQIQLSAASNDLPCGALIDVINVANARHVLVPVTDTGAFRHPDVLDLSRGAFRAIAELRLGVIPVRVVLRSWPKPSPPPHSQSQRAPERK